MTSSYVACTEMLAYPLCFRFKYYPDGIDRLFATEGWSLDRSARFRGDSARARAEEFDDLVDFTSPQEAEAYLPTPTPRSSSTRSSPSKNRDRLRPGSSTGSHSDFGSDPRGSLRYVCELQGQFTDEVTLDPMSYGDLEIAD